MSTFDVLFLGTCAADFSPKLQTEFVNSFDFDARRASSVLLNGRFLIDCGPHCLEAMRIAGVDISAVTDVVITHFHGDHFNAENIEAIAATQEAPLRLWVSEEAVVPAIKNIAVMPMKKLKSYAVSDTLTVTGLYANHDVNAFPQHILFEQNGKTFLYATDGAWFMNASYNFLKGKKLDLMVIDATCGDYEGDWRMAEHNSIPMIRLMLPSLRVTEILKDNTEIYLSHIAPSLHKSHAETVEIVKPAGLKVAYDGLQISV